MLSVDPTELMRRLEALPAAAPLRAALSRYEGVVYLVGGAVRDLARGETPRELDLLVEEDPVSLATALPGTDPDRLRAHPRFGTASVVSAGFAFDIARARIERYDRPGALPSVAPAEAAADLRRRDFTVNAMALALAGARPGSLLAAPDALADLRAQTLRSLHSESFRDDPTRLLRLARYTARLGFAIAPETLAQARTALAGGALETVSAERIGAELRLLAAEDDPVGAFMAVSRLGLDPALAAGFGLVDAGVARRALAVLPDDGRPAVVVLAAAMLGMPAGEREAMLARWAFPASERDAITAAARRAPALAAHLADAITPSQIAAAVRDAGPEAVALAAGLAGDVSEPPAGAAAAARLWLDELRDIRLEISGDDLLAAGVPAGIAVGAGLRAALAARLDGRVHGRAAELAEALKVASA